MSTLREKMARALKNKDVQPARSWAYEGHGPRNADLIAHAPTDLAALIEEVRYLRGERAAVVAWLREGWGAVNLVPTDIVSAEIERGEHRREEEG